MWKGHKIWKNSHIKLISQLSLTEPENRQGLLKRKQVACKIEKKNVDFSELYLQNTNAIS